MKVNNHLFARQFCRWSARRATMRLLAVVLAGLLLTAGTLIADSLPGKLAAALADDDGPGGGGGGGGGAPAPGGGGGGGAPAPGGGGGGFSGPSGGEGNLGGSAGGVRMFAGSRRQANCFLFFCQQPRRRVRTARAARAPAPPPPPPPRQEFVLFDVTPEARAAVERARFTVVAEGALTSASGRILRVRAPQGMGSRTGLQRLATAAPGAVVARNDRFRSFRQAAARGTARSAGAVVLTPSVGCAAGAVVAMVDTGIDLAHPALAGASITQMPMRASDRQPSATRHGTAVASMLVGREGGPAPGLSPAVRLIAVDAFHRDSSGQDATDAFDLARALDLLSGQPADVINLSLTGPDNAVIAKVVSRLVEKGRTLVAAAGNDGPQAKPMFPAAYAGVIAVTAVDAGGKPWRRSARGQHVAFAAVGVDLSLAGRDGGAEAHTGTSFAAPAVAVMVAAKRLTAGAGPGDVSARLVALAEDRGDPGRDAIFGHGLLQPADACRAIQRAARE